MLLCKRNQELRQLILAAHNFPPYHSKARRGFLCAPCFYAFPPCRACFCALFSHADGKTESGNFLPSVIQYRFVFRVNPLPHETFDAFYPSCVFCKYFENKKTRHQSRFPSQTMSTAMSAGETPEILDACPRLSGLILSSFCLASSRNAEMER